MSTTTTVHYIATDTDRSAIYGLGTTADEAIADAYHQCAELTGLVAIGCSAALSAEVADRGGAIAWDEADGIACTTDEADA